MGMNRTSSEDNAYEIHDHAHYIIVVWKVTKDNVMGMNSTSNEPNACKDSTSSQNNNHAQFIAIVRKVTKDSGMCLNSTRRQCNANEDNNHTQYIIITHWIPPVMNADGVLRTGADSRFWLMCSPLLLLKMLSIMFLKPVTVV